MITLITTAIFLGPQLAVASDSWPTHEQSVSTDLEPFLNAYFSSWSDNDMQGYRNCFHTSATVVHVARGQVNTTVGLDAFITQQANHIASLDHPVSERMVSFTANEDIQGSTVMTRWVYEGKNETYTGVDHFTLIRDAVGAWKIVSLVWYRDI